MDVKVGDLVSIKSDFPGRNFNINYLSSLGVVTFIFQSALIVDKGDHNYRDCAFVEWVAFDENLKGQPDAVQPFYNLVVISEV
jgi:hypothetical protein|tara:strand:- start:40 stop:288 length:249 start_codon:yes stop_codon:yes gene_type:complete